MSFGTGLSGIAAANKDLQVTGNNIANASTTGFKSSRTEFGDAYTNSFLGYGQDKAGAGVRVSNIGQKFDQGNISQTNSALDLAVDGNGFFVMEYPNGSVTYTRSGIFGVDKQGFITGNTGAKLQGFGVDENGIVNGVLTDLEVDTGNQPPRGTHDVDSRVNVPAGAQVLQQDGTITRTNGLAIGAAQTGSLVDTNSTLSTVGFPTTAGSAATYQGDPVGVGLPWTPSAVEASWTFDVTIQGPNINGGTAPLTANLQPFRDTATYNSVADMVSALNGSIQSDSDLAGKIRAVENPAGTITFETNGPYATDGTSFVGLVNSTGTLLNAGWMNFATPTVTSPVAGTELFTAGGFIDLTSDPGQAANIQGNDQMELEYNNFIPGTNTTLTSGTTLNTLDNTDPFANADAGNDIAFNINVGSLSSAVTMTVPAGGYANQAAFATAIETAVNGALGANTINANVDGATNRLVLSTGTAVGIGPEDISIVHNAGATTSSINMNTVGMAVSSSPAPTRVLGEPDTPFNNQLDVIVDGGAPLTITIPPGSYASYNELIDQINTQIQTTPGLAGEVSASHVNGRLSLERTDIGEFPIDIDVADPATGESIDALGFASSTKTVGTEPVDRSHSFRVNLTVPAPDEDNRSGSVVISLDETILSVDQLAAAINRELAAVPEEDYIGVQAEVVRDENDNKKLQFVAIQEGEAAIVSVTNILAPGDDLDVGQLYALLQVDSFDANYLEVGEAAITNGYPEQSLVLFNEEADERTPITIPEGATAAEIAALLSEEAGVDAEAETQVRLLAENYGNSGDMDIIINGQRITANSYQDMVDEINQYQQSSLNSITAALDDDTGDIVITSSTGIDVSVSIDSPNDNDTLTVQGFQGTAPVVLGGEPDAEVNAKIGGFVDIILNEGYTMIEPDPRVTGLFNGLTDSSFEDYTINAFNPDDTSTYNEVASLPIYDSIGNQHQLQLFYVKNPGDENRPNALNSWTVYAQIDGENVGDPDTSLPFPENTEPSMASFQLFFNPDGTIDEENTGEFLISNWSPIDPETGEPTGAYVGLPEAQGGRLPIPDPNVNSNFAISFDGTTQYGGPFARYDFQQDGYASGRLQDLEVGDDGIIFARYTNGEAQVLGQVALASFANNEGLDPVGNTEWKESFASGDATIGEPGTGLLGNLQSAALEDSTVDLSEQLVHLIIAQRNYQASAKTIETANAVTQTIINLR
ncbi:flagellar hook-basal body complex protein [Saccharospirillum alexandrii]|uniref:flagellar hook-basal body complex protein n=1 Tax=Saccharospirillum alexandrii TaxID=2448477 RepID=UPI000FD9BED2|nr:flagellar hook-basal body complex protein [Saccharospirillum alexandrii]